MNELERIQNEYRRIEQYDGPDKMGALMGSIDWRIEEKMLRKEQEKDYFAFIQSKVPSVQSLGVDHACYPHAALKPHQADIVRWCVAGGRRAIFAAFGLGKTLIQLEVARQLLPTCGRFLIVAPLGVRQEFIRDGKEILGVDVRFVRRIEDAEEPGIYITNYETIRDGKMDPRVFGGTSLDEASVLRGFGGTKTFREFMGLFEGVRYKFVATATPSPNDYIELLAYAAFLEIMDVSQAKTRFFKRDSTKADELTIHPHKEREFWLWCASWGIFLQRPSDLGYSDDGYILPEIDLRWHEIPSDHAKAGAEPDGQQRMFKRAAIGVVDASRERRDSLTGRIEKLMELRAEDPSAHRIIWHDLEWEREALERAIPSLRTVYGSQDLEERERHIVDFTNGKIQELGAKPVMCGSGCNFQRHCAWAIYLGIGFKFNDFIQSIHRLQRFLQTRRVRIDLIYTESERQIRAVLEEKWEKHKRLMAEMTAIIREFGLAQASIIHSLARSMGVKRSEHRGENFTLVNNDSVLETRCMESNSVDMILTSIPFSTQYEYSPNYMDFGHSDDNRHFWRQMDFLTPELLRTLKPGRIACIHVKDRIVPGGMTGLGFQVVYPFHADAIRHFSRHSFAYMGMKTIVTDVVRENKQTYRLGWTEQCKDGTKMGVGMPEYLLMFRKPPTDNSNSYADEPVVKNKGRYSRSRWQLDAHGYARSSGQRLLKPEDLDGLKHDEIFQMFKNYSGEYVYNYEQHVALCEHLEKCGECGHIHTGSKSCGQCECTVYSTRLPVTFMLLQPASWSDEVWADVTRMLTLNGAQHAAGREMHLCPMQFDIADRAITQFTNPGEVVYDPFGGIGSVPYRALLLGRRAVAVELSTGYHLDAITYCTAAEQKINMPTLFDLTGDAEAVATI